MRRDRHDKQPNAVRDDEQCQYKQKRIDTEQNVFDVKLEIEPGYQQRGEICPLPHSREGAETIATSSPALALSGA